MSFFNFLISLFIEDRVSEILWLFNPAESLSFLIFLLLRNLSVPFSFISFIVVRFLLFHEFDLLILFFIDDVEFLYHNLVLWFFWLFFFHNFYEAFSAAYVHFLLKGLDLHGFSSLRFFLFNFKMSAANGIFNHFIFLSILNEFKEVLPSFDWLII